MLSYHFSASGNWLVRSTSQQSTRTAKFCPAIWLFVAFVAASFPTQSGAAVLQQSGEHTHIVLALWSDFKIWLGREFHETPAIVLGVGFALMIPPIAVLALLFRRRPRFRRRSVDPVPRSVPVSGWRVQGILSAANNSGDRHIIGHGLVRIGREEDNDVQLAHRTVHRYHAVIERTPEAEFVITDVSGGSGNGVRVDGQRVERARLRGGELIEIGRAQMRFQLSEI